MIRDDNESIIQNIKEDQRPIYLYGAGSLAVDIFLFLKEKEISITGAIVDDEYYKKGMTLNDEIEVLSINQLNGCFDKISLIAANAEYVHINEVCRDRGVAKVYFLTPIAYGRIGSIICDEEIEKRRSDLDYLSKEFQDTDSKLNLELYIDALRNGNAMKIMQSFKRNDYFSNDVYRMNKEEVFCDIGAYTGDTIEEFYNSVDGSFRKIYAFEGDCDLVKKVETKAQQLDNERITVINTCLWSESKMLGFGHQNDSSIEESALFEGDCEIKVMARKLDDVLEQRERISLIKINFKCAQEVLKGAETIIREDEPKIACVVGFSIDDLIEVVKEIRNICSDYKFFLRYRLPLTDGLVLFACKMN